MTLPTSHAPFTGQRFGRFFERYPTTAPCALLTVLTVLSLLPFIDKAVHVDDTVFLFTTKQILSGNPRPLDAPLNWYGSAMKLAEINKNPPLFPYLLVPVAAVFGFSEVALHAAMMLPAIGAVLGTFFLSRRLCHRPLLATLLMMYSPAFFVSATTIMSDVPMFCFWIWAIVLWLGANDRNRSWPFIFAGVCIALAALCTYIAVSLIPLLLVCAMTRKHWKMQTIALLIPVAALWTLQFWTARQYGQGLVSSAIGFTSEIGAAGTLVRKTQFFAGPCFMGGCFVGAAMLFPATWGRRAWQWTGVFVTVVAALIIWQADFVPIFPRAEADRNLIVLHVILFGLPGTLLLCITAIDLCRYRDRQTFFLAAWIFGIFTFTTFVNWSANGRAIMAVAPAICILAVRALDRASEKPIHFGWLTIPVAVSAGVSLLLATADQQVADAARQAAKTVHDRAANFHGTIWFNGHWGFQWYMQNFGAQAMDYDSSVLAPGDLLVQPPNNTNVHPLPPAAQDLIGEVRVPVTSFVGVVGPDDGAEFYSSIWGPLPYVFAPQPMEDFRVYRIRQIFLPPATATSSPP